VTLDFARTETAQGGTIPPMGHVVIQTLGNFAVVLLAAVALILDGELLVPIQYGTHAVRNFNVD